MLYDRSIRDETLSSPYERYRCSHRRKHIQRYPIESLPIAPRKTA